MALQLLSLCFFPPYLLFSVYSSLLHRRDKSPWRCHLMKGTQSGPAQCASISSSQPTHPHQCTINENLFHSASQSTHTYTHTPLSYSLSYSLSLATFTTHIFKSHLELILQLAFRDTLPLEGITVLVSSPSPTLPALYSSGVAIAVHVCSTNISEWHQGTLREQVCHADRKTGISIGLNHAHTQVARLHFTF